MAIPLSVDVTVKPGVLAATGSAIDLNGIIFTDNTVAPVGVAQSFTSLADVGGYYGTASTEYDMARVYFTGYDNASRTPGQLFFWAYPQVSRFAFLRSASLSTMSLADIKSINGSLTITISGTPTTSTVDLSTATSFANAATLLDTAFSVLVDVTYDTNGKAFVFELPVGSSIDDTIAFATGAIASDLLLTEAKGAVTSLGSAAITDAASNFVALKAQTQNFSTFTTSFEATIDQHVAFSQIVSASASRFAYVGWSNPDGTIDNYAFANTVINTYGYGGVLPVYGEHTDAAAVLSYGACLNFELNNGRRSLKFREFSNAGLIPKVTTEALHNQLIADGYTAYGVYSENNVSAKYFSDGTITGDFKWFDAYLGQIWVNANIQGAVINALMSEQYIGYNTAGRIAIETPIIGVMNQFGLWGGFSTGATLTPTQTNTINSVTGVDVSSTLSNQGYFIYIGPFTPSMRAARTSPVIYIWYVDGGVIQEVYINSIEVQ